jgi:glyoxylase-like metal-dependent hydrolase (beta-lactamase superfamily II)
MREPVTIVTVRYKSTNCYFVEAGDGLLAFDAGWPGTYTDYKDGLKAQGYSVKNVKWLIVSHFHLDHAGLAGTLLDNGAAFVVFPNQLGAIDAMEALIEREAMPYRKIDQSKLKIMEIAASRAWLASIGIAGEVLHTPGHGEQCISLLLDGGEAFIGDLAPENAIAEEDVKSKEGWELLKKKGAKVILPAHAGKFRLDKLENCS